MQAVRFDGSFAAWRAVARASLAEGTPPDAVAWQAATDDAPLSLSLAPPPGPDPQPPSGAVEPSPTVPRPFLKLARLVACHRDPERWPLLYRALWRQTHGERHLLALATDDDVHRLFTMGRAVKRAAHKMTAFVRFRRAASSDGDQHYVAWFEPEHYVVDHTAPFFARRFAGMEWTILTPYRLVNWDGERLAFGPGAVRASAPRDDELEDLWRTYYANIFNPARLNRRAMRAEMPKLYWQNLPEARLIPSLTAEAPARTAAMLAQVAARPAPLPAEFDAPAGTSPAQPDGVAASPLDLPGRDAMHDPGVAAARARAEQVREHHPLGVEIRGGRVLAGVAAWTDPTLLHPGAFYPPHAADAEARLRHYASLYPMVEVDATYYSLPTRAMAVAWAARTPPHFVFDIKAHALMTGHPADVRRLPDWIRRHLPRAAVQSGRVYARDLPAELLDEVWTRFLAALEPLVAAGKLGAIFLQYPPWFTPSRESAAALRDAHRRLGRQLAAVEFRCGEWMAPRLAPRTLALLEELQLAYTVVDGPQGMASSIPRTAAVTSPKLAVLRLHGRRTETWETTNAVVTERYRYLYDRDQLAATADLVDELLEWRGRDVHVVFNNNHSNYGTTNALELSEVVASRAVHSSGTTAMSARRSP